MTHLVCTGGQAVLSLEALAVRKRLLAAAAAEGFDVQHMVFTLHGRCSARAALPRLGQAPRGADRPVPH